MGLDCPKELPTDAGTAVMAATASARASVIFVNIVILLVAKAEANLCGLDRATRIGDLPDKTEFFSMQTSSGQGQASAAVRAREIGMWYRLRGSRDRRRRTLPWEQHSGRPLSQSDFSALARRCSNQASKVRPALGIAEAHGHAASADSDVNDPEAVTD